MRVLKTYFSLKMNTPNVHCVVLFENLEVIKVIPSKWIEKFMSAENVNCGSKPHHMYKIFYSPDSTIQPDFQSTIRQTFVANEPGCYNGHVLRSFGKFTFALKHCWYFSRLCFSTLC